MALIRPERPRDMVSRVWCEKAREGQHKGYVRPGIVRTAVQDAECYSRYRAVPRTARTMGSAARAALQKQRQLLPVCSIAPLKRVRSSILDTPAPV